VSPREAHPAARLGVAIERWRTAEARARIARWAASVDAPTPSDVAASHGWLRGAEARELCAELAAAGALTPDEAGASAAHLARAVAEHALAASHEALRAQLGARVPVGGDAVPLPEVVAQLVVEASARRREVLAASLLAAAARALPRLLDARAQADAEGARVLAGLPPRPDAGPLPESLREEAGAILAATDDAAAELVAAAVRASGIEAGAGGPLWHDLVAALRTRALDGHVPPPSRFRRIGAALAPLGFARELGAHVRVAGTHGGLDPRARIAVVAAPRDVRIAVSPLEHGLASELAAFDATGRALAIALGSVGLPPAFSRPLDASVPRAFGALFAQLHADPLFVRRVLGLSGREAESVARASALVTLLALRVDAAVVLARAEPPAARRDAAAALLRRALGDARVPDVLAALVALTPGAAAARFRGRRGGLALHVALREHADADWFRNPRSSEMLRAMASRGGALSVEGALAELGGAPNAASPRLRELLGA
jgi:hypothetical protein